METVIVTIDTYDQDGALIETRTVNTERDVVQRQVIAEYRVASEALLTSTTSVATKAWVRSLNALLRVMMAELREQP